MSDPRTQISASRRDEVIAALRRGAVPSSGLDALAVGLEGFERAIDEELEHVSLGHGAFKAVRGEYGAGKTFFVRWLQQRAMQAGFATAEVQISETETPLHRLETVYRRAMERLTMSSSPAGALQDIVEQWFYTLETDALRDQSLDQEDDEAVEAAVLRLMELRLANIARSTPQFAATLRAYHEAQAQGDVALAQGLMAWLSGQPNISASVKRAANLKGDIDHFGALSYLEGLLVVLRGSGLKGLVLVLDEVETLQRVRSDVREKSLNALRQWIDEVDGGRFPGLYIVITGTPSFYEGPQGVQRLAPLAQRLHTDFSTDPRWDNPRAVQVRLLGMDLARLEEVGRKVRDLYAQGSAHPERILSKCDDAYIAQLAAAMAGRFSQLHIAPRQYLKKLVADVLDRVDQFESFEPRQHYTLTLNPLELDPVERAALDGASRGGDTPMSVDDIDLSFE